MIRGKVVTNSKSVPVDIPVDTGVSQNLPAPMPLQTQAVQPMDAGISLDEALKIYWGPLSGKLDRDHMAYFFSKCKLYGLNPLRGQAHAVPRKRYENGREIYDVQFTVAYTAMIEIAKAQPDYRGVKLEYYYRQPDGTISTSISPNPANFFGIIATGFIDGIEPIVGHFWWHELRVKNNSMWDTSPEFMTMKTVWMRILTLMYPGKFQGLYEEAETNDQMVYRASDIHEEPAPKETKKSTASVHTASPANDPVNKPASPMDILTGETQGTLPMPPATPKKEAPPIKQEVPQEIPVEEVQTDIPQVGTYMDPVVALAQAISTNGDIPYQKKNIAGYYSKQQHDLLVRLMKRHFISDFDKTKVYSAMLGVNTDGTPIEIKDNGVVINYLSVNMAATVTDQYLRYEKEVEEFIKYIIDGWGRDKIKNELKLKLTVVERLIGLVCSDYTRKPQPIVDEQGNQTKTKCFADFKNDLMGYGIEFLTAEQVLEKYNELEAAMKNKESV